MLSMSFLSLMGLPFDPTSLRNSIVITSVVTVSLTLLALFVNDGHRTDNNTSVDRRTRTNGVTA
jgi:hypothetical protein